MFSFTSPIDSVSKEDPRYDYLLTYSDFHKEAYGFRPRYDYYSYTLEQLVADYDRFSKVVEEEEREEELRQKHNSEYFESLIAKTINLGANDRVTALRWIIDGADESDIDYILYKYGLSPYNSYGAKLRVEIEAHCLDILNRVFISNTLNI
jgi:ABC-type amino acid transport substrate-binding protein